MELEKVEFRDGERWVPGHVAYLLRHAKIESHTLTYDQAVKAANQAMVVRRANDAQQALVKSHFRR